jgi:CheY-like chemotaxis protein
MVSGFSFYDPAVDARARAPAERQRIEAPGGKGELLLVVEDDPSLLLMARVALTKAGYRVATATNGAEALDVYAQQPQAIRAVLTDMMMPVMAGGPTIEALRQVNPAVKVITFSGLFTGAATDRTAVPGVQAVLPKPYSVRDLLTTVRGVLDAGPDRTNEPVSCGGAH